MNLLIQFKRNLEQINNNDNGIKKKKRNEREKNYFDITKH